MNRDYRELLPVDFNESSRVWVYQSSRTFTIGEALQIEEMLNHFTSGWKSHGTPVKGYGNLFYGQFVVLIADETATGVSGCSTDSSVRLIKQIEQQFGVDMFNRTNLAFLIKEKVQVIPISQLSYAIGNGFIQSNTLYFNNLVETLNQLKENWIIPISESWLKSRIKNLVA